MSKKEREVKNGRIVFGTSMTEDMFRTAERLAEDMGLNITSFVRYLITKAIKEDKQKQQ
jgi:antitoxin component of RelBE/YafQ-DinJ toxin-antitoxin module